MALPCQISAKKKSTQKETYSAAFDSLFFDAMRYKAVDNLQAAIYPLTFCYELYPNSAIVNFELGKIQIENNNFNSGLNYLKRAAKLDPDNYYYQITYAKMLVNAEYYNAAETQYKETIKHFPDKEAPISQLCILYTGIGKYKEALDMYDQLQRLLGVSQEITYRKMQLCVLLGNRKRALSEMDELIKKSPLDPTLYVLKGEVEMNFNNPQEAIKYYEQALEIAPDNGLALASICNYYNLIGDTEKTDEFAQRLFAAKDLDLSMKQQFLTEIVGIYTRRPGNEDKIEHIYKTIVEADPENSEAHQMYADVLIYLQRTPEAIEELRTATYLEPENTDAWVRLYQLAVDRKDSTMVRRVLTDALEAIPYSPVFFYLNGTYTYVVDNNSEEAYKYFIEAEKNMDESQPTMLNKEVYDMLSMLSWEKGDTTATLNYINKALAIAPNDLMLLNNYAYYLATANLELDRAERMSQRTVESDPLNASYLDTYAYILMKQGKYNQAFFYIQRAMEYDNKESKNYEIIEHCGDILYFLNSIEDAVKCWQQSFDLGNKSPKLLIKINQTKYVE